MTQLHITILISVASLISLIIICSVALVTVMYPENVLPEVLINWGGIILGFFFGALSTALTNKTP